MDLIVGGRGLIGTELRRQIGSCCYTTRQHGEGEYLDLMNPEIDHLPAAKIVYLVAGVGGYKPCEGNSDAWRINVDAPIAIARAMAKKGAFIVFVSSESVEWGNSAYARQKAQAESYMNTIDAAILRPAKVTAANVSDFVKSAVAIAEARKPGVFRWP